jgi:hypothetical protein
MLISSYPKMLLVNPVKTIGTQNDAHLSVLAAIAGRVVCGWGTELEKRPFRWRVRQLHRILGPDVQA